MSFSETASYFKKRFSIIESVDQIKHDWNQMAMEYYTTKVTVKSGVIQFLQYLKVNNILTGIATRNSRELGDAVLESLHLKQYFKTVNT